jgi:hypothetical protein
MPPREKIVRVGQRIEIDIFEPDFNHIESKPKGAVDSTIKGNTRKILSHGGAKGGAVCVDAFSGYLMLVLLKSFGNTISFVRTFVAEYRLWNIVIEEIGSDSGIVSQSIYEVSSSEVERYILEDVHARFDRAEPYNHDWGGAYCENAIGQIKPVIAIATMYLLQNPNVNILKLSKLEKLMLWGELAMWAVHVINLSPCPNCPEKSRHEVFTKQKPNMQKCCMLPICSMVLIPRITRSVNSQMQRSTVENRVAIYVGPAPKTPGAIRAAIKSGKPEKTVKIIISSHFSHCSDGGGFQIHEIVQAGTNRLINELNQALPPHTNIDSIVAPETDQELLSSPASSDELSDTSEQDTQVGIHTEQ